MRYETEIRLLDAIAALEELAPIKILFNNIVLYNDYDSFVEVQPGVYGEVQPPRMVIENRLWQAKKYVVTDISIQIVQYHHSIIKMKGYYAEDDKEIEDEQQD